MLLMDKNKESMKLEIREITNEVDNFYPQSRESVENEIFSLLSVSGCLFATWLQDNYSTNKKHGFTEPLPKGKWRKDFTNDIYDVDDLWKEWINNR